MDNFFSAEDLELLNEELEEMEHSVVKSGNIRVTNKTVT